MPRTALKVLCIVFGVLFAVFGVITVFSVIQTFRNVASSGIIGGADAPTMSFALQKAAQSPVCFIATVSFFAFIATGLGLILNKEQKR